MDSGELEIGDIVCTKYSVSATYYYCERTRYGFNMLTGPNKRLLEYLSYVPTYLDFSVGEHILVSRRRSFLGRLFRLFLNNRYCTNIIIEEPA